MAFAQAGPLYLAGGLHDALGRRTFHSWVAERLADRRGKVLILPTAGDLEGARSAQRDLYAAQIDVQVLPVLDRADAVRWWSDSSPAAAAGLYLTGGNAGRFVNALAGTALGQDLRAAWEAGAPVVGVSAGAAGLGGLAATCPDHGGGWTSGLGWLSRVVLMPHCDQPGRLSHLREAIQADGDRIGLGLASDTWLADQVDGRYLVMGAHWACLVTADDGRTRTVWIRTGDSFAWPAADAVQAVV